MKISSLYKKEFDYGNLINIFHDKIKNNSSQGVDGISSSIFEKNINYNLITINRKIENNTYKFTPFKTLLLSRGAKKLPRKIAQPTIRDKVVLRAIYNILIQIYKTELDKRTLHSQIKDAILIYKTKSYNHVLRFDIKDFFPSLNHEILLKKLDKKITHENLIYLIKKVLETPFDIDKAEGNKISLQGIAQGLSIASIVANIYLFDLDKKYENIDTIKYYRYVDDILIYCDEKEKGKIKKNLIKDVKKVLLEVHIDEKADDVSIDKAFDFLGYSFFDSLISVRKKSIQKIINSLIKILTFYNFSISKNLDTTLFRINLRITGCFFQNKKFGWLFFFSQMEDEKQLHSLDYFLSRQLDRFGIDRKTVKSFVRSWYEIRFNFLNSNYIPNFDIYSSNEKSNIIRMFDRNYIFDNDLDDRFSQIIHRETSKLERDMSELS